MMSPISDRDIHTVDSSQKEEETYLSAKHIAFGKKFTVASFDGGGVRGIVPIKIMNDICKRAGLQPDEFIDMGIGTSTGGLLCAAYLGQKDGHRLFKASALPEFWKEKIKVVFHDKYFLPCSDGIFWVKYSADGLEKVIGDIADETMNIKSNMSSPTIFTSFDATAGKPFYFRSIDVEKSLDKTIYRVDKVLRCTTAAPGYLPAAKVTINHKEHAFLDGGLVNNNPSLVGYVEAQNLAGSRPIRVLSFGTGEVDYTTSYNRLAHAGFLAVAPVVFNSFFSAMEAHPTQILSERLKDNFHRFQLYKLDSKHSGLDDVSSIPYLEEATHKWLEENDEMLERVSASLKPKFDPEDPYAKPIESYT